MKSWILRISLALLGLFAILGVIFLLGAAQEINFLRKGPISGFNLDGVYKNQIDNRNSLSFHTESNKRWQMVDAEGNITDGTFRATEDPNIFFLTDAGGNEYGIAHLAYVSSKEDQGRLYLRKSSDRRFIVFDKVSKHPGFTSANGSTVYFN